MRQVLPVILGSLLLAATLPAQNPGMSTEYTRTLTAVSEMGHSTIKPEGLSRSLTFEEGDDPTIAAHPVSPHTPVPAEHVVVFTNLAALLSGQSRYAEAEAVARQAMKLHNFSFSANYVLGSLLVNQRKFSDEAKTKLEYAQVKYAEARTLVDHWPDKAAR